MFILRKHIYTQKPQKTQENTFILRKLRKHKKHTYYQKTQETHLNSENTGSTIFHSVSASKIPNSIQCRRTMRCCVSASKILPLVNLKSV